MKLYICEICGDAYIGGEKPADCPFCGAKNNFIKPAKDARPIVNENIEAGEKDVENLLETLDLEIRANAIYLCMAGKTKEYAVKVMYKRLAKIELEHATIAAKILKISLPEIKPEACAGEDAKNFQKTVELERHAVELYKKFAAEAKEGNIRKLFGALAQAEAGHIELINNL